MRFFNILFIYIAILFCVSSPVLGMDFPKIKKIKSKIVKLISAPKKISEEEINYDNKMQENNKNIVEKKSEIINSEKELRKYINLVKKNISATGNRPDPDELSHKFRELLADLDPNIATEAEQISLLHFAADMGLGDLIEFLVIKGADIEAKDTRGATPLIYAAANDKPEAIRRLIGMGAMIEAKNEIGTALIYATQRNKIESVKTLLELGAKIDTANNAGITPLMKASQKGNLKLVIELLGAGANVEAVDGTGLTALMHALHNKDEVKIALIRAGAYISSENTNFKVLIQRVLEMKESILSTYHAKEFDSNDNSLHLQIRLSGLAPMLNTAFKSLMADLKQREFIESSINQKDAFGQTPLDIAMVSHREDLELIGLMLERGANPLLGIYGLSLASKIPSWNQSGGIYETMCKRAAQYYLHTLAKKPKSTIFPCEMIVNILYFYLLQRGRS